MDQTGLAIQQDPLVPLVQEGLNFLKYQLDQEDPAVLKALVVLDHQDHLCCQQGLQVQGVLKVLVDL